MTFQGFPLAAFDFYDHLAANNTKAWWTAHKAKYEQLVRDPLVALTASLAKEFGEAKLFRPYNDQRFHKGEPYKTHQGATVMLEDGIGYYVQVSAAGLMIAGGWYSAEGEQTRRYREGIDSAAGAEVEHMVATLKRSFDVDGNQLATKPKGYDAHHPRIELLRNRRLTVAKTYPVAPWLATTKSLTVVRRDWRAMRPLLEWLADHVGPAHDPGL